MNVLRVSERVRDGRSRGESAGQPIAEKVRGL